MDHQGSWQGYAREQSSRKEPPLHQSVAAPRLPFSSLLHIARFSANPPAVYALCMTAKYLHEVSGDAGKASAIKVLREALTASLHRILRHHEIPLSAVSFEALHQPNGAPSALVSGSAMVQVALGEVWDNSDVDIWCTGAAAPAVRSKLRDSGFTPARDEDEASDGLYEISMQPQLEAPQLLPTKNRIVEHWDAQKDNETTSGSDSDVSGISGEKGTDSKGGLNPKCGLDLVVADEECTDPHEMLQQFDILICAISYDGITFHIPQPHLTFRRKSLVANKQASLMQGFTKQFLTVRTNIKRIPYLNDVLVSDSWMQAIWSATETASGEGVDEHHLQKVQQFLSHSRYFNFFLRLFQRQQKYVKRGIEISNPEPRCSLVAKDLSRIASLPMCRGCSGGFGGNGSWYDSR